MNTSLFIRSNVVTVNKALNEYKSFVYMATHPGALHLDTCHLPATVSYGPHGALHDKVARQSYSCPTDLALMANKTDSSEQNPSLTVSSPLGF